jgi:hypothetical protein
VADVCAFRRYRRGVSIGEAEVSGGQVTSRLPFITLPGRVGGSELKGLAEKVPQHNYYLQYKKYQISRGLFKTCLYSKRYIISCPIVDLFLLPYNITIPSTPR